MRDRGARAGSDDGETGRRRVCRHTSGNIGPQCRGPDCRKHPGVAARNENSQAPTAALMSTSIGIAICPNDAADRQALLSHADTALYRAKLEGRGTYRFFEATMGAEVRDRRLLEHDLRHAISRGELRLVYQPQKDIKNDRVCRLRSAAKVERTPSVAIFRLRRSFQSRKKAGSSCRSANGCCGRHAWKRLNGKADLTVAVNVSAVQLHNAQFRCNRSRDSLSRPACRRDGSNLRSPRRR